MPGFSFQSLFYEDPERQLASGPGATSEWRIKPRSLMDEDAAPRFPAFQQAWKQGADVGELFGPEPPLGRCSSGEPRRQGFVRK